MPWPRRILHVTPFLWSGAGGALVRLAEAQAASSEIRVVTAGRAAGLEDWPSLRRRLRRSRVSHTAIDFFAREPATFWDGVERLAALAARWQPDVIHTHAGVPACAAAIVRDRRSWAGAIVAHLNSWGVGRPAWMDGMDAWGLGRADRVVCISRAYLERLVGLGVPRRAVRYVPWGIDLAGAPAASAARENGTPVIGFVGRIEPRKDQIRLVEAFGRLRRRHRELRLELVGPIADEAYAAELAHAIARSGAAGAIALMGHVEDVAARVGGWRVFVSPSRDEGQGLAVLEAMALGVPVVAAAAHGIEDFVEDGRTGRLVRQRDGASLARAIDAVLRAPYLAAALRRHARRLVERRYRWEVVLPRLSRIYDEAMRATTR